MKIQIKDDPTDICDHWHKLKGFAEYLMSQGINPSDIPKDGQFIIQLQGTSGTEYPSYDYYINGTKERIRRPFKDKPCDFYGNPKNPDGTVQAYVIPEWSTGTYKKAKLNIKFNAEVEKMSETRKAKWIVFNAREELEFAECSQCGLEENPSIVGGRHLYPKVCAKCGFQMMDAVPAETIDDEEA